MSELVWTCANHPNRETSLRCNRCEKPICTDCAVQTPVGYRCRECVRGQQKVFETSLQIDYPIAGVVAAVSVGMATSILNYLFFWGLIVAPVVGGVIAEGIRFSVRRRRSPRVAWAAVGGAVAGVILYLLYGWFFRGLGLISLLWPIGYGVLMISTMYYRLRGISL